VIIPKYFSQVAFLIEYIELLLRDIYLSKHLIANRRCRYKAMIGVCGRADNNVSI